MILAVLQARTSSQRLPGKVLEPILGKPMLARQIERVQRAGSIDRLVVATSTEPADAAVAEIAADCNVACFRGSLDDVLDRFYQAARADNPSHVVRLTGDCPLADWEVIDRVVGYAVSGGYDYASNTVQPTWPDGLDVEVAAFPALETAWVEGKEPACREHVMPFLSLQPQRFKIGNVRNDEDLSGLRWTVDEPVDLQFVRAVYAALYPGSPAFSTADILDFLTRHPDVARLNADLERDERYRAGLSKLLVEPRHG